MVSHRQPGGLFTRWSRRRPSASVPAAQRTTVPAQRRPGIELVDARTRVRHTIDDDEAVRMGREGKCHSRCGELVLVGSMTDPGRISCTKPECYR